MTAFLELGTLSENKTASLLATKSCHNPIWNIHKLTVISFFLIPVEEEKTITPLVRVPSYFTVIFVCCKDCQWKLKGSYTLEHSELRSRLISICV